MRCSAAWVVLIAGTASCHRAAAEADSPPVPVHCVATETRAVDDTLALRGRIATPPGGDLSVASQVAGRIVEVAVKEGQRIAHGDLVASVDAGPSRDALRQAEAALEQSRAAELNANTTLERAKALVARGIAAKQELDDAVARADAAHAAVASAVAAVDTARRTLGRVEVRSSFDGLVTRIWRGPGALVDGTAATPIIQLAASGGIEFVAETTADELSMLAEGQPVTGQLVDARTPFAGTVRVRASALDPTTGLGTVRILLVDPPPGLPLGAFGRVVVTTKHREGVLTVPGEALRGAVADGAEVVVCKDGKASLSTVGIGWRDDKAVEITRGLTPGDRVAVDHVLGLEDGTAIAEVK
jgi:RND family efflux transporter MFP subunit